MIFLDMLPTRSELRKNLEEQAICRIHNKGLMGPFMNQSSPGSPITGIDGIIDNWDIPRAKLT